MDPAWAYAPLPPAGAFSAGRRRRARGDEARDTPVGPLPGARYARAGRLPTERSRSSSTLQLIRLSLRCKGLMKS